MRATSLENGADTEHSAPQRTVTMSIWELPKVTLPISSKLVQPLNFAVFDIVLISLVFHFSSDVAGRLNDVVLRHGAPERLHINCPPVIGGGLVSTRKVHVALLLLVRVVGLALILASELTLNGITQRVDFTVQDKLMQAGQVTNFSREQYQHSIIRRTSCIASNGTLMYYGLVIGDKNECVTDLDVVFDKAVRFGLDIVNETMGLGKILRRRRRGRLHEIYHERGIMQCENIGGKLNNDSCRAVLKFNNVTYLSESGAVRPAMPDEPTEARIIENHDWQDDRWFDGGLIELDFNLVDAIHAVYGASVQNTTITLKRGENRTDVSVLWLAALLGKVLIVVALALAIVVLRAKGYRVVVNDERRLVELLRRRIEEADPRLTRDGEPNIFLNAARQPSRRLHIVAAGHPGAPQASTANAASIPTTSQSNINTEADLVFHH